LILTVRNHISITGMPDEIRSRVKKSLRFLNPKYAENERLGRWNRGVSKYLDFYRETGNGRIVLPRGYIRNLILLCRKRKVPYEIRDHRQMKPPVEIAFTGRLKPFQQQAADKMLTKEFGILQAPTGAGKTVIGLYMMAKRRQPSLVVVHTKDLAMQWMERIAGFLAIPEDEIGFIGGGKKKTGKRVTVAMVQTLYKCVGEITPSVGFLVVDECHRAPSRTFTEAVSAFDCRYMLGLTATPWRRDKLSNLIYWHLGDIHHSVDKADLVEKGHILPVDVIFRETEFEPFFDAVREYPKMLAELTADDSRNRLIAADIASEAEKGEGVCLVLSDRKKHCQLLQSLLKFKHGVESALLTGDVGMRQRREIVEDVNNDRIQVIIATGQLIGEGFDCKALTTLFIATPVKFSGRLIQYLGRVLRPAPGKSRAKVYDYVDGAVGPLKAAAVARQRVYESSGGRA
jgi:superfamily II DNA or RNA helicase